MADDPTAAGPTSTVPTSTAAEGDVWPDRAADLLETTVGALRTKTVVPLTKVAQILVFALILAAAGVAVVLLLILAVIRLTQAYLPIHPHARAVWVSYAGLGAIFVIAGAFFMRKRSERGSGAEHE